MFVSLLVNAQRRGYYCEVKHMEEILCVTCTQIFEFSSEILTNLKIFGCGKSDLVEKYLYASSAKNPQNLCMAINDMIGVENTSYIISVDLYNYDSKNGPNFGNLGLAFNLLGNDSYEGVFLRYVQLLKEANGE